MIWAKPVASRQRAVWWSALLPVVGARVCSGGRRRRRAVCECGQGTRLLVTPTAALRNALEPPVGPRAPPADRSMGAGAPTPPQRPTASLRPGLSVDVEGLSHRCGDSSFVSCGGRFQPGNSERALKPWGLE